jgi:microcystin-dependent protein
MTSAPASVPRRHFIARLAAGLAGGAWLLQPRASRAATQVTDPFLGELRLFAGTAPPSGWMFCEGQLLSMSTYNSLFQLIGTTYGGDGVSTFALPDLRGRAPMHVGPGFVQAQFGGVEQVTLTVNQIPSHTHAAGAASALASTDDPTGMVPARNPAGTPQYAAASDTALSPSSMQATGGSTAHNNMQPFLAIHFIIRVDANGAIFPSQT